MSFGFLLCSHSKKPREPLALFAMISSSGAFAFVTAVSFSCTAFSSAEILLRSSFNSEFFSLIAVSVLACSASFCTMLLCIVCTFCVAVSYSPCLLFTSSCKGRKASACAAASALAVFISASETCCCADNVLTLFPASDKAFCMPNTTLFALL